MASVLLVAAWLSLLPAQYAHALGIGSDAVRDVLDELRKQQSEVSEWDAFPLVSGRISLGVIATSGNTESESVDGTFEVRADYPEWRHTAQVSAYRHAEDAGVTGERYAGVVQSDFKLTSRSYVFANGGYARDRFGGYERRATASVGLGQRVIQTPSAEFDLEAGLGRRVQEPADSDEREWDTIVRLRGRLEWSFSDSGSFGQELQVETGRVNSHTESVTSVKSKLAGALSLRMSYTVQHDTEVPAGTENTDKVTSMALEYAF